MSLKFEFDDAELTVIAQALGLVQYRIAAPIINKLQAQLEAQKPKPEPVNDPRDDQLPTEQSDTVLD